ncbi:MAG: hypothetical protein IKR68_06805 [Lachnospiraceae bacterium]|nr:hypothetical protein [Lachnospiraceae bacterium]
MKNLLCRKLIALGLASILTFAAITPVFAAEEGVEAVEGEGEIEGEEVLEGEGEIESEISEDGGVTMSELTADNGRYIASAFPESYLPQGFHKSSCTYEGQNIEIAYMDNDQNGEVVLAYLADMDGGNGDFYLCDINTAHMSDFVQITNGESGYIVVLDPGDVIVAPSGYTRARLEWYGGKSVTAWLLPGDPFTNSSSSDEEEKTSRIPVFGPVNVYGASIGAGLFGDDELSDSSESDETGESEEAKEEEKTEEETEEGDKKEEKAGAEKDGEEEDGSRVVYAEPSDFFMVYAIDNTGTVGFYIYDKVQRTYQRYIQNSSGSGDELTQYKKSAQTRLYIIVALAFLLVVLLFVLVNTLISRRDDDYDDGYDEDYDDEYEEIDDVEKLRRKVNKKTAAPEPEEYEEPEIDDYEETAPEPESAPAPVRRAPARRSSAPKEEIAPSPAPARAPEKKPGRRADRSEMRSLMDIDEGAVEQEASPMPRSSSANIRRRSSSTARTASGQTPQRTASRPASSRSAEGEARRPVSGQPKRRTSSEDPRRAQKQHLDKDFEFEFIDID